MTLRLRLVAALTALVLAGLTLFALITYSLYARSQYDRLDEQVRASAPFVSRRLAEAAGLIHRRESNVAASSERLFPATRLPALVPLTTYSVLIDNRGGVLATVQMATSSTTPRLPAHIEPVPPASPYFFTTSSEQGPGGWRVYVTKGLAETGTTSVVAVPMDEVSAALKRLVTIEASGGGVLLALLCVGAWLILRKGLRPLERMAETAGEIASGDLSQRVEPAGEAGEVAELGRALNRMLDEIERAFAEQDNTEQRLRQFLADVSHELRTPLTSIQGFAELFRIGGHGRVDLETILRRIEEESRRMRNLVEDLLLLAHLDQTRPIETASVDLAVLAADACSDAVAAAPCRQVVLDAPEPVVIAGDEPLLRQAIANLVSNALQHTSANTAIEVSAKLAGGEAVIVVRDHGSGLEPDALAHVFDRFWRADRARAGNGAGLGLAIVSGIAAEHGGTVSAANAPDGGAVFTLRLPLCQPALQASEGAPPLT